MRKIITFLCTLCVLDFAYCDEINIKWFDENMSEYTTSTCESGGDLKVPEQAPTKRGYTFVGWQKPDYIPLQYIENIGKRLQRIDTGIFATPFSHVQIKVATLSASQGDGIMCAARGIGFSAIGVGYYYFYLGQTNLQGRSGVPAILEQNKTQSLINNNPIGTLGGTAEHNKIYIFSCGSDATNANGIFRVYWAKIWDNDILVRNFIPVLDSNNIPCLFDTVSQQYFYDEKGNNFIAGPIL